MTFLQAIILGIVQGLTEFLPISSSAHLALVPYLLNWTIEPQAAFIFNVLVQLGTLGAVFVYFWKDLITILDAMLNGIREKAPFRDADSRLGWLILAATVPAGLIGLVLKDLVENAFGSPVAIAVFLFITAIMLTVTEIWSKQTRELSEITWKDAVLIGLFQAAAIFPVISRSGATITGGMRTGLKREAAARFSFLMSIPIMLAASLLAVKDLAEMPNLGTLPAVILIGFIASSIVGYLATRWFLGYLRSKSLIPFAVYCAVLAIMVIFVAYLR